MAAGVVSIVVIIIVELSLRLLARHKARKERRSIEDDATTTSWIDIGRFSYKSEAEPSTQANL